MFAKAWRQTRCPIGIDLGSHSIKLLQLERCGDHFAARAAITKKLDPTLSLESDAYHEAVTAALKAALNEAPFQGRNCVSTLPKSIVQCKNLRLPQMPAEELAGAVQWEAHDRLRFSADEMTIQYFDAGEVRQGADIRHEAIVLAAPTSFIEQHVQSLIDAGLKPDSIDATSAALARLLDKHPMPRLGEDAPRRRKTDDVPATLALELGRRESTVLIADHADIRFSKPVPLGIESLEKAIIETMDVDKTRAAELLRHQLAPSDIEQPDDSVDITPAEGKSTWEAMESVIADLGRELSLCLRYFSVTFRGSRPEEIYLLGSDASNTLAQALSPHAGLPVLANDPLHSIDLEAVRGQIPRHMHTAWAVAAGLSLRGAPASTSPRREREAAA